MHLKGANSHFSGDLIAIGGCGYVVYTVSIAEVTWEQFRAQQHQGKEIRVCLTL